MKKSYLMSAVIILILIAVLIAGCAKPTPAPAPAPTPAPAPAEVKPVELRMASHIPGMSPFGTKGLTAWSEWVNEATNGKVKITIYYTESLCKIGEELEATKAGRADIAHLIIDMFPSRFHLTRITSYPFMHVDSGTVDGRTLTLGGINSYILQELYDTLPDVQAEWADYKVMYLLQQEPFILFTSKKPVRNQEDLKGMKIRALPGSAIEFWKRLGAAPTTIPVTDLYESLEKGVIDGLEMGMGGFEAFRLYEQCPYETDVTITSTQAAIIMNKEKWNSFSPDIQDAIMSVSGKYAAEKIGEAVWGRTEQERLRGVIKEKGYTVEKVSLDPGELDKWKGIGGEVSDMMLADIEAKGLPGRKTFDEAMRLMEKYK